MKIVDKWLTIFSRALYRSGLSGCSWRLPEKLKIVLSFVRALHDSRFCNFLFLQLHNAFVKRRKNGEKSLRFDLFVSRESTTFKPGSHEHTKNGSVFLHPSDFFVTV
jgi:hypothetical protein